MRQQPSFSFYCFLFLLFCLLEIRAEHSPSSGVEPFIKWVLEDGEQLEGVRFGEVVEAVSGKEVLPVDPTQSIDTLLLERLENVFDAMLGALNEPDHAVQQVGRINEVSRHIEDFLLIELNRIDGVVCAIPPNASGEIQRLGYPDLRVEHEASGRVFYIDPKVYRAGSETSSFRTFYFEPKKGTNKILDDASHLIVGVAHSGKVDGLWKFDSWKLVDLIDFRVRLKAEFQASNRELYKDSAVLLRSE